MNQLNKIPEFELLSIRGAGTFGYVIEAFDKHRDTRVAIKRTHKVGNLISREFQILNELKGQENIINMHSTFYTIDSEGNMIQNFLFEYIPSILINKIRITKYSNQRKKRH